MEHVADFVMKPLRSLALWLRRLDTSIVMLALLLILALLMVLALTVGPPVYRRH
jgi:hypothetical protein